MQSVKPGEPAAASGAAGAIRTVRRVSMRPRISQVKLPLRLRLRFGIVSRIHEVGSAARGHRPRYALDISGRDEQLRFLREIGVSGSLSEQCESLLSLLESAEGNPHVDTVPREVWNRVRE